MLTSLLDSLARMLSPARIIGPVFEKELRVSSRRRRNYTLRFVHIALLTITVVLFWLSVVRFSGSGAWRIARMAEAGKMIVTTIVWFQFCAVQIVAIVMCSTSISDEIYHKTLGVLMTTPINSLQIVMGKLFSKLLQLILLAVISVPLLAVVRVFGGVPWDYIIKSFCITLTAALFVASLSLLFSIFSRRAYVVILMTMFTLGFLFALLPFIIFLCLDNFTSMSEMDIITGLFYAHPVAVLAFETALMHSPRGGVGGPNLSCLGYCGIILVAAAVILAIAVRVVRKVALRQAVGQLGTTWQSKRAMKKAAGATATPVRGRAGRIRRVKGSPVLWKEWRHPLLGRHKKIAIAVIIAAVALLALTYILIDDEGVLDEDEVHVAYAVIFVGMGMLFALVLPATAITSEKESRCWPGLLATTASDGHIVAAKFVGLLRRCAPIWILLFVHLLIFCAVGIIHPVALPQMAIIAIWIVTFFCGTGLYFSSLFRRTTTAVVANFSMALLLWLVLPVVMFLTLDILDESDDFAEDCLDINPFIQTIVVIDATAERHYDSEQHRSLRYRWPSRRDKGAWTANWILLMYMAIYMFVAVAFAWRAKCRLRRNVF